MLGHRKKGEEGSLYANLFVLSWVQRSRRNEGWGFSVCSETSRHYRNYFCLPQTAKNPFAFFWEVLFNLFILLWYSKSMNIQKLAVYLSTKRICSDSSIVLLPKRMKFSVNLPKQPHAFFIVELFHLRVAFNSSQKVMSNTGKRFNYSPRKWCNVCVCILQS